MKDDRGIDGKNRATLSENQSASGWGEILHFTKTTNQSIPPRKHRSGFGKTSKRKCVMFVGSFP